MTATLVYTTEETPVGPLGLAADDNGLVYTGFEPLTHERALSLLGTISEAKAVAEYQQDASVPAHLELSRAVAGLRRYFDGDLSALDTVKVHPKGTAFQRRVWEALRKIQPGTTWSYSELAEKLDNPAAVRAVGGACRNNPVCLVIPCHRVIGKNKSLTGFAGGLERKAALLKHEGLALL